MRCRHWTRKLSDDGLRYTHDVELRDKFSCPEHKHQITYKDHLEKAKTRKSSDKHLAPVTAKPKYSKGDNPGFRFKIETSNNSKRVKPIRTIDGHGKEHKYVIGDNKIYEIRKDSDE